MKMKQIEINIDNNRRFADVALLLDRSQLLKDINELRTILELPIEKSKYGKWVRWSEIKETTDSVFQNVAAWLTKQPDCKYTDYLNKKHVDLLTALQHDYHGLKEKFDIAKVMDYLVSFLCQRYKKNMNFRSVIRMALILNTVTDNDYETTMLKLFPPKPPLRTDYKPDEKEFFTKPNYFGFALYFLPNTPMNELVKILDRDLPKLRNMCNDLVFSPRNLNMQPQDVIPNIKWYRDWYWLHNQYSYQQIVNLEERKSADKRIQGIVSKDRVIQGIKAYKKFLAMETS